MEELTFITERRELERAKLHGPDWRTIDALEYVLGAGPPTNAILRENWHAIEGLDGQCACGPAKGRCGDRLAAFIAAIRGSEAALLRVLDRIQQIADFEKTPGGDMLPDLMGRLETIYNTARGALYSPPARGGGFKT